MSSPTIWSAGRYQALGERIESIAAEVVAAVDRRGPVRDAALVDLACGTGSAALAACARGARVTAVDITPELIAIGARSAQTGPGSITWMTADAADTGLPSGSFDAVVSNMGIVFVEPVTQVAEITRLLKPQGVLSFSSWIRDPDNPFFTPITAVLGPPPPSGYTPDQWGQADIIADRPSADFDDVEIDTGFHNWQLGDIDDAMVWVTRESPIHVSVIAGLDDDTKRERLLAAFGDEFRTRLDADGNFTYDAPYAVVTARRR